MRDENDGDLVAAASSGDRSALDRLLRSHYDRLYTLLAESVRKPDVVIYLQGSLETCLKRIKKKKGNLEKSVTPEYLAQLIEAYNYYFYHYDETPLLVVDTEDVLTHGQRGCVHAGPNFVSTAPPRRYAIPRACSGPSIGMRTSKRVQPGSLFTRIVPPCFSTIR